MNGGGLSRPQSSRRRPPGGGASDRARCGPVVRCSPTRSACSRGVTETHLTVRTADGDLEIALAAVTAAKRIPDRRARSATERLELVAAAGWPPVEKSFLGDWLLRASGGWTGRGNSALAVGDPGRPTAAAVDAVIDVVRRPRAAADDRRAAAAGPPAAAGTRPARLGHDHADAGADGSSRRSPRPRRPGRHAPHREPTEEWFAGVGGRKGGLPPAARTILTGVPEARYAAGFSPDGALVATARGTVTDGWLGITVVGVDPTHRRRGWARRLTLALVSLGGRRRSRAGLPAGRGDEHRRACGCTKGSASAPCTSTCVRLPQGPCSP